MFLIICQIIFYYLLISKPVVRNDRPDVRLFSKKARELFFNKLDTCDWSNIYASTDASSAYNVFSTYIETQFNDCFPKVKLSRKRARDKKWITSGLKKSSRTKNKLYKKWLLSKTNESEVKYKNYRKIFKKLANQCETEYYKEMFDKQNNSIRQIWKNLNIVCSFKPRINNSKPISKILVNGTEINDREKISYEFNSYFTSVGPSLIKNSLHKFTQRDNIYQKYCPPSVSHSMFCEPVEPDELLKLITSLKNKSAGPDNVGPALLKDISPIILHPLLHIINLSFSTGMVPDKLKLARVIPVFKAGDGRLPLNYRPISLLSVFHKIIEKLMATRVTKFITATSVLYNYQFGFRQKYSTVLALIDVIDEIYSSLDNKEYVMGIYLDLKKAFDTVDHNILLWKLHNYGIRGVVHSWFTSYLNNRTQYTTANGVNSSRLRLTCGVPQGSVLGPLLFLLYINDISTSVPGQKLKLFADDTNIFITGRTLKELEDKANSHILNLNMWLIANKLHLNMDKTCYSIFSPSKSPPKPFVISLKINDIVIKHVSACKYLGVLIDDELKWTSHVETVVQKLQRVMGICYKISYKLPDWCLRNIYFAFVHPYILYGVEVYGNTCASYLDKLTKLNNKILRILQKKERNCCSQCLYAEYNTLPPLQLFNYQILNLAHKVIHSPYVLPVIFRDYFTFCNSIHDHNTRHNNLFQSQINSRFGQQLLKFKVTQLWNSLPHDLTNTSSLASFRKKLKTYLRTNPL